jgi:hypothetical protein
VEVETLVKEIMDHISTPATHDHTVHVTKCCTSKQSDRTMREGEGERRERGGRKERGEKGEGRKGRGKEER